MKPDLEYASSIWSPLASLASINKLKVMQHAALLTATGCIQDTNIQSIHDSYFPYSSTLHNTNKNTTSITSFTQTYNIRQYSKAKTLYSTTAATQKHSHRPQLARDVYIKINMKER